MSRLRGATHECQCGMSMSMCLLRLVVFAAQIVYIGISSRLKETNDPHCRIAIVRMLQCQKSLSVLTQQYTARMLSAHASRQQLLVVLKPTPTSHAAGVGKAGGIIQHGKACESIPAAQV